MRDDIGALFPKKLPNRGTAGGLTLLADSLLIIFLTFPSVNSGKKELKNITNPGIVINLADTNTSASLFISLNYTN